jgi:diacylglycerol O-acyltransferase
MHVAGIMVLDDSDAKQKITPELIKGQYEERMHLLPPLRRRLVTTPGNVDFPWWIEDPDFNIDYHIRHRAVPAPGTDAQMRDLVCHIFSVPWTVHDLYGKSI